jgi:hypothetical protein
MPGGASSAHRAYIGMGAAPSSGARLGMRLRILGPLSNSSASQVRRGSVGKQDYPERSRRLLSTPSSPTRCRVCENRSFRAMGRCCVPDSVQIGADDFGLRSGRAPPADGRHPRDPRRSGVGCRVSVLERLVVAGKTEFATRYSIHVRLFGRHGAIAHELPHRRACILLVAEVGSWWYPSEQWDRSHGNMPHTRRGL